LATASASSCAAASTLEHPSGGAQRLLGAQLRVSGGVASEAYVQRTAGTEPSRPWEPGRHPVPVEAGPAHLLPRGSGWEDDLAFENGIGFTDIVKRPTRSATEVPPSEFVHGRELLQAKIEAVQPRLVTFTFKKTADVLFGPIAGTGQIQGLDLGGAPVFVMPGPFRPRNEVEARLSQLRAMLD